jgi:hypothetical protein
MQFDRDKNSPRRNFAGIGQLSCGISSYAKLMISLQKQVIVSSLQGAWLTLNP